MSVGGYAGGDVAMYSGAGYRGEPFLECLGVDPGDVSSFDHRLSCALSDLATETVAIPVPNASTFTAALDLGRAGRL